MGEGKLDGSWLDLFIEQKLDSIDDEDDLRLEGPFEQPVRTSQYEDLSAYFYLGPTRYKWDYFPWNLRSKPSHPRSQWSAGDYYDRPTGWRGEEAEYEIALNNWKLKQVTYLTNAYEKEIMLFKLCYQAKEEFDRDDAWFRVENWCLNSIRRRVPALMREWQELQERIARNKKRDWHVACAKLAD